MVLAIYLYLVVGLLFGFLRSGSRLSVQFLLLSVRLRGLVAARVVFSFSFLHTSVSFQFGQFVQIS